MKKLQAPTLVKDRWVPGTPNPLTEQEKAWINNHLKTHTVLQMSEELHRSCRFIYDHLDEIGAQPLKTTNKNGVVRLPKPVARKGYFNEKEYGRKFLI